MKVIIAADHPRWAQMAHADGLMKYAPVGLDVETCLLGELAGKQADVFYLINLYSCLRLGDARIATCAASHAWTHDKYDPDNWRTRGVNPRRCDIVGRYKVSIADAVVCRNRELEKWASQYNANSRYLPAGVDPEIWHPAGRTENKGKLRVGWCGQVNNRREGHFKGYYECWLPLVERLHGRYAFEENTRTAAEALSWQELADWYRSLDVFVTTATAEGTPNNPFCAAACGCAVISTDVGQCSDWDALRGIGGVVPSYGNEREAAVTIDEISGCLNTLESPAARQWSVQNLLESVELEYSYKVVAPRTLEFVCGREL